jgi:hypothetical protein
VTEFSRYTVGRLFIDDDGVVWEQTGYTEKPTGRFARAVDRTQTFSCTLDSALASSLRALTAKEEADFRAGLKTRVPIYADGEPIAHVQVPQAFADLLAEKNARIEYDTTPIIPDLATDEDTERIR